MADKIIKLTDEHSTRAEEAARMASDAGATASAIFERRDPVNDSRDATANRRGALDDL